MSFPAPHIPSVTCISNLKINRKVKFGNSPYSLVTPSYHRVAILRLLIKNGVSVSEAFCVTWFTDITNAQMLQNIREFIEYQNKL